MHPLLQCLSAVFATFFVYILYVLMKLVHQEWSSPLKVLPGPDNPSFIWGNESEISESESMEIYDKWDREFGSTIRYHTFMGMSRLYTTDTKALNHILMNSDVYQKPESMRFFLSEVLGPGLLVVEGETHKRQRRVMNPAFGSSQVRDLTEIFIEKSCVLRDVWLAETENTDTQGTIDVYSWLSRMTLDVIGLAGFNYHFDALTTDPEKNELNQAFKQIFQVRSSKTFSNLSRTLLPPFRYIVPAEKESKAARRTMTRIGEKLLNESRVAASEDQSIVGKPTRQRRDLLSLLVRANLAKDLAPHQRMSDGDFLAQVPTFLVAGHETTSVATSWALYALTQAPIVQSKLRQELSGVSTDNPTMDELNDLPYLDAVIRESLRLYGPLASTLRVATRDDVLPLGKPVKGKDGVMRDSLLIKKNQAFHVPLLATNLSEALWGEDARQFKPDRWLDTQNLVASRNVPGIWGNMMNFLGGPRACIGYRFALVEMKALLFTLVRAFEFELAVAAEDIRKKPDFMLRPLVNSQKEKGHQLPLRLKPVSATY